MLYFHFFYRGLIEEVLNKCNGFSFDDAKKIVFCGQTGHGKSTLINALIEHDVLPTSSAGSACTSALIEVVADDTDKLYRAKVEFLSQQDWEVLLESMQTWLPVKGLF